MKTLVTWSDRVFDREGVKQCIYNMCFRPDGTQLIVAAGLRVLVYDTTDGDLLDALKGHKDTIYCVSYASDGKRFASGGADATVIIWTSKLEGILKYSHNEPIQCLAYNPVTQQLASCTSSDFGLWSPEQKSVTKHRVNSKVLCCSWTNDGQFLALGHFNGVVSIRDKDGGEKVKIERIAPVWCMSWNPSRDEPFDVLCVGDWNQKMAFFQLSGRQIGKDKDLGFDPCSISYFSNGEYLCIGGSDKKVSLWTKEGVRLTTIGERDDWVWSCRVRPRQNNIAVGANDGTIAMYQLVFNTVHGLYQDRYAYRDFMTDVIIQNLTTEEKVRIKCRDYVKKIAIYRDRLAVQLPNQIVIYELLYNDGSTADMHYKGRWKIQKQMDCNLLVVTSMHILLCQEKKLQLYDFRGEKEREWVLDSLIRYVKVVGGPKGREGLLVGLKNGLIVKIFVDNAFPIHLIKQNSSVRCLDLSSSRRKLAMVDEGNNCLVYDLKTQELLFQESNANSVAWNTEMEDMLCFSGNGLLNIKAGLFPVHQQKLQGFVVGFKGSKIFCLHIYAMQAVDVPQSASLYRYLEKKDYENAHAVACLGVTEADWRLLANEALQGLNFSIARKAFIRLRDLRYIELVQEMERKGHDVGLGEETIVRPPPAPIARANKVDAPAVTLTSFSPTGIAVTTAPDVAPARQQTQAEPPKDKEMVKKQKQARDQLVGDILAFQGKFQEAAKLYGNENVDKSVAMYSDLKKWNEAKVHAKTTKTIDVTELMRNQAKWAAEDDKDWQMAARMYRETGDYVKAIDIIGEHGAMDELLAFIRKLSKAEESSYRRAGHYFKERKQYESAEWTYIEIADYKELVALYIEQQKWMDAIQVLERHPEFTEQVYLPYAKWLAENDRFEEAQKAFRKANKPDISLRVMEQLTDNAVTERRYDDASYYYWVLACEYLTLCTNTPTQLTEAEREHLRKFRHFSQYADFYYAYNFIYKFTTEPFTTLLPDQIFNISRWLVNTLSSNAPVGISRLYTLRALAKQSEALKAYKTARFAFEQLQHLRLPANWSDQVDLATITLRSKPFSDQEDLVPACHRCGLANPLISKGNKCHNCKQKFSPSFYSFDNLPLIQFHLPSNITDEEAVALISRETTTGQTAGSGSDKWQETRSEDVQTLAIGGDGSGEDEFMNDPFGRLLDNFEKEGLDGPLIVDRRILLSLDRNEVFVRKWPSPSKPYEYFKSMLPEIPVMMCHVCLHFFHEEDFELASINMKLHCPFCRSTLEQSLHGHRVASSLGTGL